MPVDQDSLDKWPQLKNLMRRFSTRHRIGMDDIETEKDQNRRLRKQGVQAGYRSYAEGQLRSNFDAFRERNEKYRDYSEMSEDAAVSGGLDIYADEASQADTVDRHVVKVEGDDEAVVEEIERLLYQVLRVDEKAWDHIRRLCTYGDAPYEIKFRKDFRGVYDLVRLDHRRFDRIEDNNKLVGFRLRAAVYDPRRSGKTMSWGNAAAAEKGGESDLSPFRMVHFRLPDASDSIYGRSVLEAARRTWRQVRLMEDSIVIYRISRGAERRVFYVNVGNLAEDEAEGYIKNLMAKFRKKPFINPRTNEIDDKANPLAWDEDFFIPIQDNKDNTRIEQLPGGQNMGEIEDLKYFRMKIDSEMKIPSSYLSRDGNFDSKSGLSQQDIRFSRTIDRIQRSYIDGLNKVCFIHLMLRGFTYKQITSFTLRMTPPSALAELLRLDALSMKLETVSTARGTEVLPDIYILTEILGLGEDEANELLQLKLQQDQQKAQGEAAAGAAGGGGGGGLGGMGGGEGGPTGGAVGDLTGGGAPPPDGTQPGEEQQPGAEGAPPAQPGTPEMASLLNRKAINEGYHFALNEWVAKKKSSKTTKRRAQTSTFEHLFMRNEMGGLNVKLGDGSKTLNESLLRTKSKLITENEKDFKKLFEEKVKLEKQRLLTESL